MIIVDTQSEHETFPEENIAACSMNALALFFCAYLIPFTCWICSRNWCTQEILSARVNGDIP